MSTKLLQPPPLPHRDWDSYGCFKSILFKIDGIFEFWPQYFQTLRNSSCINISLQISFENFFNIFCYHTKKMNKCLTRIGKSNKFCLIILYFWKKWLTNRKLKLKSVWYECTVWQYWFWSFKQNDSKLDIFCQKQKQRIFFLKWSNA